MKNFIKIGLVVLISISATMFNSCKKAEKGDTGPQGPVGATGPEAITRNYTLTFNTTQNWQPYTGFVGLFDTNDVIVTYVNNATYGGEEYYVQLPYVFLNAVNFYSEVGETTGKLYLNTDRADGTSGSPWTGTVSVKFKSVLIKSRAMQLHPNLDLKDYNAVKKAFNLKD